MTILGGILQHMIPSETLSVSEENAQEVMKILKRLYRSLSEQVEVG